jgi:hypothetical protein
MLVSTGEYACRRKNIPRLEYDRKETYCVRHKSSKSSYSHQKTSNFVQCLSVAISTRVPARGGRTAVSDQPSIHQELSPLMHLDDTLEIKGRVHPRLLASHLRDIAGGLLQDQTDTNTYSPSDPNSVDITNVDGDSD